MEQVQKLRSEITVRISLGFQDSPEVHTLLALTPVRGRGKLVLVALENYIKQTNHTAGEVSTQLAIIENWLKERSENKEKTPPNMPLRSDDFETKNQSAASPSLKNEGIKMASQKIASFDDIGNQDPAENPSSSINRWLSA